MYFFCICHLTNATEILGRCSKQELPPLFVWSSVSASTKHQHHVPASLPLLLICICTTFPLCLLVLVTSYPFEKHKESRNARIHTLPACPSSSSVLVLHPCDCTPFFVFLFVCTLFSVSLYMLLLWKKTMRVKMQGYTLYICTRLQRSWSPSKMPYLLMCVSLRYQLKVMVTILSLWTTCFKFQLYCLRKYISLVEVQCPQSTSITGPLLLILSCPFHFLFSLYSPSAVLCILYLLFAFVFLLISS